MIIYFTGTGNSRYIAESIAAMTKDAVISAKEYIKRKEKGDFTSDTPFVFVCPTYAWRIPRLFEEFIQKSTFQGSNDAYFVMNCGSDIGNADAYLKKLCNRKKFAYKGVAEVVMPENYIAMYEVPDKIQSDQIILEADKRIPDIAAAIRAGKVLLKVKVNLGDELKSRITNPLFYALIVNSKGFHTTAKCNGCGTCVRLCPLNNIKLENKKPVWGKQCTHCMACICACPPEAIEYKKSSAGKPRYYNRRKAPGVTAGI